jgi:hypothetical protein
MNVARPFATNRPLPVFGQARPATKAEEELVTTPPGPSALYPRQAPNSSVAGKCVGLNDHLPLVACPPNQPIQPDCHGEVRSQAHKVGRASFPGADIADGRTERAGPRTGPTPPEVGRGVNPASFPGPPVRLG